MKKLLVIALSFVSAMAFADTYPPYKAFPEITTGFAKRVIEYNPGNGASGIGAITDNILGAPDDLNTGNQYKFLSLGQAGNVIVEMDTPLKSDGTSYNELYVFENRTYEKFDVYVSSDLDKWTKLKISTSATSNKGSWVGFNLDGQVENGQMYPYVKVVDTGKMGSTIPGTFGADIDALVSTAISPSDASYKYYDTDSLNGKVFNLYQNTTNGAIGIKLIRNDSTVSYIPFSFDNSLEPVAISVQSDFNGDGEMDMNVLATNTVDNVQVNIIKQQDGTAIKTIDNSVTK
ncbi:cell envelope biogenesis protein OmpA [Pectobacterium polaris]|nr:cell envelope biogenesis protein OmpA [Pectobacterium polaris]MBN3080053.1 cell envelope biogenesis protein OmpA [Pectobacterium polaris]